MPASITSVLASALVFSARVQCTGEEPKPEALNAKQVLDRMATTYADCKSYEDCGVVKTTFIKVDGSWIEEKPFRTAFVRPDRFRFEYCVKDGAEEKNRYIVWREEKDVRTWWDIEPRTKKLPSLSQAVAGATGVSSGSAHTIPALLLAEEIGGVRLTEINDARRIEDAKLDSAECFRIHGRFADSPMTLWIDKKTYLVRRIDELNKFKDFRTLETTTYAPKTDGEVAETMLDFIPAKRK